MTAESEEFKASVGDVVKEKKEKKEDEAVSPNVPLSVPPNVPVTSDAQIKSEIQGLRLTQAAQDEALKTAEQQQRQQQASDAQINEAEIQATSSTSDAQIKAEIQGLRLNQAAQDEALKTAEQQQRQQQASGAQINEAEIQATSTSLGCANQ
ncbi:unknown protein [Seminavis robusta]|uniref:Uncharacterized protein n=1 Tax=Seminavis robusta TaxID=568900 RepID=A0A9N8D964_9STRA|nr:unknown protein [Seminavis robusta]|eukprot:Sro38_g023600.1 n/a (152) ;mRNA; r:33415-33973